MICDNCDSCGACTYEPEPLPKITEDMFYVNISAQTNPDGSPMHPEIEGQVITHERRFKTTMSVGEMRREVARINEAERQENLRTYIEKGHQGDVPPTPEQFDGKNWLDE